MKKMLIIFLILLSLSMPGQSPVRVPAPVPSIVLQLEIQQIRAHNNSLLEEIETKIKGYELAPKEPENPHR